MFKRLRQFRIVPMVEAESNKAVLKVAEALIKGGLPVMEINYRTHSDHELIKEIRTEFPDFWIMAAGILNTDLLFRAIDAGVCISSAPGVNAETIREAFKRECPFAPGVCTPSDIEIAILNGCSNFQYFPAEPAGGTVMLKAIMAPFTHLNIEFIARGGIGREKLGDYLSIKQVAAVSVDWIVTADQINRKDWQGITEEAVKVRAELEEFGGK